MKDHWISQFYLRGFLDNDAEKLYVFNKKSNNGYLKSPKNICWSKDYYSLFNYSWKYSSSPLFEPWYYY